MHKELLVEAFKKVRKELMEEGNKNPSDTKCSERLSVIVSEIFPYSGRRLRTFYKMALGGVEEDIQISRPEVLNALSQYVEYEDYRDFLKKHNAGEVRKEIDDGGVLLIAPQNGKAQGGSMSKNNSEALNNKNKLLQTSIFISLVVIFCLLGYNYFNKPGWMEWQKTHYVKTSFDAEKLKSGILKVYKEERIESFKLLIPTCETQFFNEDGSVRVWYGKNKEGLYEYFTSYGLHPKTGKTLRPITKYIIEKYVCK